MQAYSQYNLSVITEKPLWKNIWYLYSSINKVFAGITITIPNLVRIKQVVWIILSAESLQNTA